MSASPAGTAPRAVTSVLLFWVGYVALTLSVGFVTSMTIPSEVGQLTAWGFLSSALLIVLSRYMTAGAAVQPASLPAARGSSGPSGVALGLLVGAAAFVVHVAVVSAFGGAIRLERVDEVGAALIATYFARFLATSCMEEIGFRGFALRRLSESVGVMPAVAVTTVAFGLSHFLYGWSLQTIALGVFPGGVVWGMSAIATRGLAVPIGLHAAWNFAGWTAGSRAETGPFRMILADAAPASFRTAGTASYFVISGVLTALFWVVHRRRSRREASAATG